MQNSDNSTSNLAFDTLYKALMGVSVAAFTEAQSVETAGIDNLVVYRQHTIELATFIKLHSAFTGDNAIDCIVVDTIDAEYRFTIKYIIQNTLSNSNYLLITKTNDLFPAVSLQSLYPAFNWAEREIWDMFGLFFIKHPDLRRILTDYGFYGHPLRKDFPLSGFREMHYEDSTKHIEYNEIELSQGFRAKTALNTWQDL